MTSYILRRLGQIVPVLVLVSAVVFFVFRVIPGEVVAGKNMSRVVGNRQARFSGILDISLPS